MSRHVLLVTRHNAVLGGEIVSDAVTTRKYVGSIAPYRMMKKLFLYPIVF